ncbi:protein MRG1-like isoform X1 [Nicotiana tabacum]|uniref:Protein MRG1-like isoform X1 n=2 Tax=Nicotiana tabacum TaxID=4097 RepID=A0A1S3XGW2_TOBAC|nr:protein MRG1-like isoform X2 [Nicotiana tomentosiformis]XP_016438942.1 PREDICTED: protein MRG1-like isoform X1 [Nicotiana tabacum]
MGSSNAGVSDNSTTISDEVGGTTHDTDIDVVDSSRFQEGEKVLAFHSQQLYEAKIQKAEFQMREWRYFVHYLGWNKNWDEWVGIDRLMKLTEENIQKQQELKKKQDTDKSSKGGRGSQMKTKGYTGGRGRKRKSDVPQKDKYAPPPEKLVNIQIPPQLKKQLIDDCEFVNHLGKLVKLPRSPNVDEILKKYHDYRLKKDGVISDSVGEILSGLQCYFDKALPAMLLYKNEREQYQESIRDDAAPSSIYGAEHLLRLFVKLPEILFYASIEDETLTELRQKLQDFLRFLQKNQSAFFLSMYHSAEGFDVADKKQDN